MLTGVEVGAKFGKMNTIRLIPLYNRNGFKAIDSLLLKFKILSNFAQIALWFWGKWANFDHIKIAF